MQIILIILSILTFVATIIVPIVIAINIDDDFRWYHYILLGILIIVLFNSTMCAADKAVTYNTPKAIDVYRGKTTLQITYVDSVPKDTIVVFK